VKNISDTLNLNTQPQHSHTFSQVCMATVILRAENLVKSYRRADSNPAQSNAVPVLQGISLAIERGEIVAIVGASGAGKSTLLHLLGALDTPDSGEITVEMNASSLSSSSSLASSSSSSSSSKTPSKPLCYSLLGNDALAALRNEYMGFIFQFHHLLPEFTALENVMMPALIANKPEAAALQAAQALLQRVGLGDRTDHKPDALSGGEQQRVAFARALVNSPAIVFADEPTGNLDPANSEQIFALMQQFRREQECTFVIVTHSMEIARAADRIITLHQGLMKA
jgi:lipoprotein-releasing system ATP-binding protein